MASSKSTTDNDIMAKELALQSKVAERATVLSKRAELIKQNSSTSNRGVYGLKSDLKKSTALVKKLKIVSSKNNNVGLLKDCFDLNLTRYLEEIVDALVDGSLASTIKPNDIPTMVSIVSIFYQRYGDSFTSIFIPKSLETFLKEKTVVGSKRRMTLRLLAELYLVGVISDASLVTNVVTSALGTSSLDVPLIVSFAKSMGLEFIGITSRRTREFQDSRSINESESSSITVDQTLQQSLQKAYIEAFEYMSALLVSENESLQKRQARNAQEELNKGEISEKHVTEVANATKLFDKLLSSVVTLADALDLDVPILSTENEDDKSKTTSGLELYDASSSSVNRDDEAFCGPFDDAETRAFYQDLPDLLELVPAAVLGYTEDELKNLREENQSEEENDTSTDDDDTSISITEEDLDEILVVDDNDINEDNDGTTSNVEKKFNKFDLFLETLDDMVNPERCDKAAVEFCYQNRPSTRKRLVKKLYSVPRTNLQLLPYYSRLVATLKPALKVNDIHESLVSCLVKEFDYLQGRKNQYRLESKIRNIRYLAELTKFNICPANVGFRCLKRCFDDFTGHNVDVATTFLETCGRYLYNTSHTHARIDNFLEIMMRLKDVSKKFLDSRAETLVTNAYYCCKPPVHSSVIAPKQYDPMYLYIMHLLYTKLATGKMSVDAVVTQLRKLPWNNEQETLNFIVKATYKVLKGKFRLIPLVITVLIKLSKKVGDNIILTTVVDGVFERLRWGLKLNDDYREHQGQIGVVKFIAELYTQRVLPTKVLVDCLYLIINFGHDVVTYAKVVTSSAAITPELLKMYDLVPDLRYDPRVPVKFDPIDNFFRIRLVCIILEKCGSDLLPFLNRYVQFLFRYLYAKGNTLPLETEFAVLDTLEGIMTRNPSCVLNIPETYKDADEAVQLMLQGEIIAAEQRIQEEGVDASNIDVLEESEEDSDTPVDVVFEEESVVVDDFMEEQRKVEDEEFEKAFKSVMQGSLDSRKNAAIVNADNMAVPTAIKTVSSIVKPGSTTQAPRVFKMLKRGNKGKVEAREFAIPDESSLAQHHVRLENKEKTTQSEMKRLVLQSMERSSAAGGGDDDLLEAGSAALVRNENSRVPVKKNTSDSGTATSSLSRLRLQRAARTRASSRGIGPGTKLSDIHYRL